MFRDSYFSTILLSTSGGNEKQKSIRYITNNQENGRSKSFLTSNCIKCKWFDHSI